MRIGLGLDGSVGLSLVEWDELGVAAVRRGFESLWTTAGGVPDPLHICARWAQLTRDATGTSVPVGIGVLPPLGNWQPLPLAAQAATVALISGGRFTLGLGSGGSANAGHLAGLGFAGRPIAAVHAYLTALRVALSGAALDPQVEGLAVAPGRLSGELLPVPLYLGALGPQMLRLAGRVADGVSLSWATPAHVAWSDKQLSAGAADAGRDRSRLTLSGYVRVCIDDDVRAARRAVVGQFLRYGLSAQAGGWGAQAYRAHFARMGFEDALAGLERQRAAGATFEEVCDAFPEELSAQIGYYGDGSGAAARYAELSAGLDETVVRVVAVRPGRAAAERAIEVLNPAAVRQALVRQALVRQAAG